MLDNKFLMSTGLFLQSNDAAVNLLAFLLCAFFLHDCADEVDTPPDKQGMRHHST